MTALKHDQEVWVVESDAALWAGRISATSVTANRRQGKRRMVQVALGMHAYWYDEEQVYTTHAEAVAECRRRLAVRTLARNA